MTNVPPPALPAAAAAKPMGLAIAGMVLGILGCVPCLYCAAPVCGILGIIFSALALKRAKAGVGGGEGFAIAGLSCGIAGLALVLVVLLVWSTVFCAWLSLMGEMIRQMPRHMPKGPPPRSLLAPILLWF